MHGLVFQDVLECLRFTNQHRLFEVAVPLKEVRDQVSTLRAKIYPGGEQLFLYAAKPSEPGLPSVVSLPSIILHLPGHLNLPHATFN